MGTRFSWCLFAIPGSHKGELREHGEPDWEYLNLLYWEAKHGEAEDELPEPVPLIMDPGDKVFFHLRRERSRSCGACPSLARDA